MAWSTNGFLQGIQAARGLTDIYFAAKDRETRKQEYEDRKAWEQQRAAVADQRFELEFAYKQQRDKTNDAFRDKELSIRAKNAADQNALAWAKFNHEVNKYSNEEDKKKAAMQQGEDLVAAQFNLEGNDAVKIVNGLNTYDLNTGKGIIFNVETNAVIGANYGQNVTTPGGVFATATDGDTATPIYVYRNPEDGNITVDEIGERMPIAEAMEKFSQASQQLLDRGNALMQQANQSKPSYTYTAQAVQNNETENAPLSNEEKLAQVPAYMNDPRLNDGQKKALADRDALGAKLDPDTKARIDALDQTGLIKEYRKFAQKLLRNAPLTDEEAYVHARMQAPGAESFARQNRLTDIRNLKELQHSATNKLARGQQPTAEEENALNTPLNDIYKKYETSTTVHNAGDEVTPAEKPQNESAKTSQQRFGTPPQANPNTPQPPQAEQPAALTELDKKTIRAAAKVLNNPHATAESRKNATAVLGMYDEKNPNGVQASAKRKAFTDGLLDAKNKGVFASVQEHTKQRYTDYLNNVNAMTGSQRAEFKKSFLSQTTTGNKQGQMTKEQAALAFDKLMTYVENTRETPASLFLNNSNFNVQFRTIHTVLAKQPALDPAAAIALVQRQGVNANPTSDEGKLITKAVTDGHDLLTAVGINDPKLRMRIQAQTCQLVEREYGNDFAEYYIEALQRVLQSMGGA